MKKFLGTFSTKEFLVTKINKVLNSLIFILNTPTKDGIKVPFIPLPWIYVKYLSNKTLKALFLPLSIKLISSSFESKISKVKFLSYVLILVFFNLLKYSSFPLEASKLQ